MLGRGGGLWLRAQSLWLGALSRGSQVLWPAESEVYYLRRSLRLAAQLYLGKCLNLFSTCHRPKPGNIYRIHVKNQCLNLRQWKSLAKTMLMLCTSAI